MEVNRLQTELCSTFMDYWKESGYGISSQMRNDKIHVTISVPFTMMKKCQVVVDELYPSLHTSVPIWVVPALENVRKLDDVLYDSSWPWWRRMFAKKI